MLKCLTIENYALIDSLQVEWDDHLNIITGETGAGKSILLGALGLLLGAKNEGQATKDLERNCIVEATFDIRGRGLEQLLPTKKAIRTSASPCFTEPVAMISAWASGKSSASEMKIITPALIPNAPARKLLLIFFLNRTSAPPMPVAAPAANVNINALIIPFISVNQSRCLYSDFLALRAAHPI